MCSATRLSLETDAISTATLLETALPGTELWYWLTNRGPDGTPLLLVGPTVGDPSGTAFAARIATIVPNLGLLRWDDRGVLSIDPVGQPTMHGSREGEPVLKALARLLRRPGPHRRAIHRLIGTRYVTSDGRSTTSDSVWERWLPSGVSPLRLAHLHTLGAVLRSAHPGDRLRFWLSPNALDDRPILFLEAEEGDDTRFARFVHRLGGPEGVRGTVRVGDDGGLVWTVPPGARVMETLHTLVHLERDHCPELARLEQSSVIQSGERASTRTQPLPSPHLEPLPMDARVVSELAGILEATPPKSRLRFWFTARASNTTPVLVLVPFAAGEEGLVARARTLCGGHRPIDRGTFGVVDVSKTGKLRFQTRVEAPDLMVRIARTMAHHHVDFPVLSKCIDAVHRVTPPTSQA